MKLVRLDSAPVLRSTAVVLGEPGSDGAPFCADLAQVTGEPPLRFRRMDRYAALGYAAAQLALQRAAVTPQEPADPEWGILFGSSTGCWSSNAGFYVDLLRLPASELSPAVFARTVSNTVNGELSIARRIGGPSETFVSGTTAGAEAIAEAGFRIAEGKARFVLAGGVEAPDDRVDALHTTAREDRGAEWAPPKLAEAAGVLLLSHDDGRRSSALRLRAIGRGYDMQGRMSLGEIVTAAGMPGVGVLVCGALPPALRDRWGTEVPHADFDSVRPDLGAAGIVAGIEHTRGNATVLVTRGWQGSTVVLAFGP